MHDPMTFETRLADAFERYLAGAPVGVDAVTIAATVANAAPRRRLSLSLPAAGPKRRVAILGLVALLLLATVATVLLVVGRLNDRPRVPWVYSNELVSSIELETPRASSLLISLRDGRVLVLGGDSSPVLTALVFDPSTGETQQAGPFPAPETLSMTGAALLADGRVLVIGDQRPAEGPVVPVGFLFDPATLQFEGVGAMRVPRRQASLAALSDGRVLVAGGIPAGLSESTPEDLIRDVEAYDPVSNTFSIVAQLPLQPQFDTRLASLPDGRAAVVLHPPPTDAVAYSRLFVFDPMSNAFAEIPQPGRDATPDPSTPPGLPWTPTFTPLSDGRMLIVGESTDWEGGVIPGLSIIWDPLPGTFEPTRVAPWQYDRAIELDDGRLILLNLHDIAGTRPRSWAATFDLATGATTLLEDLTACYPAVVKLADGRVAFIGGLQDCEIHNPDQGGQLAPAVPVVQIFQ